MHEGESAIRISERKSDHIKIALERDVEFHAKTSWLEYVQLVHSAVPELDYDSIDTSAVFLGRSFKAPIIIEGMTGGTEEAAEINGNLAEAAERVGIPMGVGSQRAAIVRPEMEYTFRVARERGPRVFLMANIGAAQLIHGGVDFAWRAVKMIEADALVVHLNPLQELIQPSGDTAFAGFLRALRELTGKIGLPVVVKEVGCGFSYEDAVRLRESGVSAIDIAGAGGTNWTEIERLRAAEANAAEKVRLAEVYREWGIPTAASLIEVVEAGGVEVVGSGGIRNGLEIAKILALGARMGGLARPFLQAAKRGAGEVVRQAERLREEVKAAMFLTGCGSVAQLPEKRPVLIGPLKDWYEQRVLPRRRLNPAA